VLVRLTESDGRQEIPDQDVGGDAIRRAVLLFNRASAMSWLQGRDEDQEAQRTHRLRLRGDVERHRSPADQPQRARARRADARHEREDCETRVRPNHDGGPRRGVVGRTRDSRHRGESTSIKT